MNGKSENITLSESPSSAPTAHQVTPSAPSATGSADAGGVANASGASGVSGSSGASDAVTANAPDSGDDRTNGADSAGGKDHRERGESAESTDGTGDGSDSAREGARARLSAWIRDAEKAKELYPGFDLRRELSGKSGARFRALLRGGASMSDAYEVVHRNELIPAAIRAAAREIEDKLVNSVISGSVRPAENGMGGGLPAMLGRGVSAMSRADRDDIARRVAAGEIIRF